MSFIVGTTKSHFKGLASKVLVVSLFKFSALYSLMDGNLKYCCRSYQSHSKFSYPEGIPVYLVFGVYRARGKKI